MHYSEALSSRSQSGLLPLGELLCNAGHLTAEQLDAALAQQERARPRPLLGQILRNLKHINDQQLAEALADQADTELWNMAAAPPDAAIKDLIPSVLAQNCRVVPQALVNGALRCVSAGPVSVEDRQRLEFHANRPVWLAFAPENEVIDQLQALYGITVENMIEGLVQEDSRLDEDQNVLIHDLKELAQQPTLVNLVNVIISNAITERASDIHIEPYESDLKVKYRIDGILQELPPPPKKFQSAVISRLKIMAGMDIAERFVPQDGQIRVNLNSAQVDIRVSTVPTVHGECVVLRLLNKDASLLKLTRLGMSPQTHERFGKLLRRPFGINLVCGPTGSGKTTTLYCAMLEIFTPERKIITIEDPVEYQIHGINQIPVRPKRGLTFASGLRSILRQDPDIVMVGEIRDRETADIAIRAALTGHLVFSTLHTNDAPGAITRLMDMGIEPFLIASSVQGALGQRLVRRLCPNCRVEQEPENALRTHFSVQALPRKIYDTAPGGCPECHGRGFYGRVGIFELLSMREDLHDLILKGASSSEIKAAARSQMQTMRQDGWEKICEGLTTPAEVLQATQMTAGEVEE